MLACYVLSPMLDSPCSAGSNVLCVEVKSSVLGGAGWRGWSPYTALCYTYSLYYSLLHLPFPAHKKNILFKSQLFSILPPVTPFMCTILTTNEVQYSLDLGRYSIYRFLLQRFGVTLLFYGVFYFMKIHIILLF